MEKEDEKFKRAAQLDNGVYQNLDATYWVKDGKILMKLKGAKPEIYRTTKNFMGDAKIIGPLPKHIKDQFDSVYDQCSKW